MSDVDPLSISAITPTQRDASRSMIRVAGKVVATMAHVRIVELGLEVGQVWTPELAEAVSQTSVFDKAMRAATRRLARRAMSTKQVRDKLRQLEFESGVIDQVIERLDELNLLDDETYGRMLIAEIQRSKPAGSKLLEQKLYQKGLNRSLIDQLIRETQAEVDPVADARKLVEQRSLRLGNLDAATRRRRLQGLLSRRGFSYDVIETVLAED